MKSRSKNGIYIHDWLINKFILSSQRGSTSTIQCTKLISLFCWEKYFWEMLYQNRNYFSFKMNIFTIEHGLESCLMHCIEASGAKKTNEASYLASVVMRRIVQAQKECYNNTRHLFRETNPGFFVFYDMLLISLW